MSKKANVPFAMLIVFGYIWAGVEFASGLPFDAAVLLLFTVVLHIDRMVRTNV